MSTDPERRVQAQAVSNAMTKLHRENYGRGPGSVRTLVGHDHVICFLENLFMPVERTLVEAGEEEAVRVTRLAFQRAMEQRFTEMIEEITGRRVRAFMSQVSIEPDIAVEVFVLEQNSHNQAPEGIA